MMPLLQIWIARFKKARTFLEFVGGARVQLLALALCAAFGAAVFEGMSLALLIPTLRGILDGNFLHLGQSRPFGLEIGALIPKAIYTNNQLCGLILLSAVIASAILKLLLKYASDLIAVRQVRSWEHALRSGIFNRFLYFGKQYFDRKSAGHLHLLFSSYTRAVASIPMRAQSTLFVISTLMIYAAMMAWISWRLTLTVMCVFPILHYALKWLIRKIRLSSSKLVQRTNVLGRQLNNALTSIPLVKMSTREDLEREHFGELSRLVAEADFSIDRKSLLIGPLNELIITLFIFVFVTLLALYHRGADKSVLASFAVFVFILRRAAYSFGSINQLQSQLAECAGQFNELFEIFGDADKYIMTDGTLPFLGCVDKIEVSNLTFSYGGAPALCGVSLSIPKGRLTALVGRTGSGKSTLLSLLVRLYDPEPGAILVDGVDLRHLQIRTWRSRVALVPQEPLLVYGTFRDNLLYAIPHHADDEELMAVLEQTQLANYVRSLPFGLETEIGDHGVRLSGGERQRLAIAQALLKDPDILILDEPTSALDSLTEQLIQQRLAELFFGKTVIIAAHRLATVMDADQVIVLEAGRVLECGTVEELLARRGAFYDYWNAQQSEREPVAESVVQN
jgi:ATP-binding cassette, subfamily B, bacterial MsbA